MQSLFPRNFNFQYEQSIVSPKNLSELYFLVSLETNTSKYILEDLFTNSGEQHKDSSSVNMQTP